MFSVSDNFLVGLKFMLKVVIEGSGSEDVNVVFGKELVSEDGMLKVVFLFFIFMFICEW